MLPAHRFAPKNVHTCGCQILWSLWDFLKVEVNPTTLYVGDNAGFSILVCSKCAALLQLHSLTNNHCAISQKNSFYLPSGDYTV